MGKTYRPTTRWAAHYLKDRFAPDGSKLPPSIKDPIFQTYGKQLTPPFEKDEYFIENEKRFVTGGPFLWISKMLQEKGPLTRRELWTLYQRDKDVDRSDVQIESRPL